MGLGGARRVRLPSGGWNGRRVLGERLNATGNRLLPPEGFGSPRGGGVGDLVSSDIATEGTILRRREAFRRTLTSKQLANCSVNRGDGQYRVTCFALPGSPRSTREFAARPLCGGRDW